MQQHGILAIWNDCVVGREVDFETWFQGEHLLERLAVPGFLFGRRHQAISGANGYFNFYLTQSPDVLTSKPYLDRLDNPTPMTRMIMSEVFINMNRTVCWRTVRRGGFRGAYAVAVRFDETPEEARALRAARCHAQEPGCGRRRDLDGARFRPACRYRRKSNCAAATRRSKPA